MINKFDEFLIEKALMMINESEVVYSTKFRKLLRDMDSPVSKYLSEIENMDIKVASNYFDISDNKDTISFIADRKAQEILGEDKEKYVIYKGDGGFLTHNKDDNGEYKNKNMFDALGYTPNETEPYHPSEYERGKVVAKSVSLISGKVYVYVKFSSGECVINEEKLEYDDNLKDVWIKNRQTVRTGRGIRALLSSSNKKFTDAEIEDFVNKYKSAYDKMNDIFSNFELVKGDDISHWYSHRNYLNGGRGTLGNSCMAGSPKDFFKIYCANPEVCSLLILKDESDKTKIKGRALVWNLKNPENVTFMDRIYTHEDSDVQLFRDYSKLKRWEYKSHNDSSPDPDTINSEGKSNSYKELSVILNTKQNYTSFPYVDTLKYFNRTTGKLSTDENKESLCLEDTGGGYVGSDCDSCGGSGRVDCWDCDGEGRQECSDCNGSGRDDCSTCDGSGVIKCSHCDGKKVDEDGKRCTYCEGNGNITCYDCDGEGKVGCSNCDGRGEYDCENCDGTGRVECSGCN